jgi:hypothetical protein
MFFVEWGYTLRLGLSKSGVLPNFGWEGSCVSTKIFSGAGHHFGRVLYLQLHPAF